jgi:hypothetical protein
MGRMTMFSGNEFKVAGKFGVQYDAKFDGVGFGLAEGVSAADEYKERARRI